MSDWVNVAAASAIADGEFAVVDVDDVEIAVFNVDGEFYAIEDLCSHDLACLTEGEVEGCEVTCPIHGARFDVRTGEALTPPAYEPVPTFPVRVEDGVVQVRDDRDD
jgi:3-phenylpropionate/trans-cinnamate dioxygenase ferredoxin subunit